MLLFHGVPVARRGCFPGLEVTPRLGSVRRCTASPSGAVPLSLNSAPGLEPVFLRIPMECLAAPFARRLRRLCLLWLAPSRPQCGGSSSGGCRRN